jgi:hypothetical protein
MDQFDNNKIRVTKARFQGEKKGKWKVVIDKLHDRNFKKMYDLSLD